MLVRMNIVCIWRMSMEISLWFMRVCVVVHCHRVVCMLAQMRVFVGLLATVDSTATRAYRFVRECPHVDDGFTDKVKSGMASAPAMETATHCARIKSGL
jgi:hypothetical protein